MKVYCTTRQIYSVAFLILSFSITAGIGTAENKPPANKRHNWRIIDPVVGTVMHTYRAPTFGAEINLTQLQGPRVELRSSLARFRVFRGSHSVSRAATRRDNEYVLKISLNQGSYVAGATAVTTRISRKLGRTLPIRVTEKSPPTAATPYSEPVSTPKPTPRVTASATPTATPSKTTPAQKPPPASTPTATAPSLAGLKKWESQMNVVGKKFCDRDAILKLSTWEGNIWYYDGIRTYQQIAEYTGDDSWLTCASYVKELYQAYVLSNGGRVGGWRVFPHGLLNDWERTGNSLARDAVILLATKSPFATQSGGADAELSRETAYLIHAYLAAEAAGAPQRARLTQAVTYALAHLVAWRTGGTSYVKPFMVGLTMEALINYAERTGDARVLPEVRATADWLWDNTWNPSTGSFPYIMCRYEGASTECNSPDNSGSIDLNLLIAPAYGWIYHKTGMTKYRTAGDTMFNAGVAGAWLGNGKQFNQNYRWSFEYIKWRR